MAHEQVRGFVLREIPIGETDRLVSILTASQGLLTAAARGARRPRSALQLTTQVFTLSDFQLFHYKQRLTIDSAELIEPFLGLRRDMDRLVCAAHLAEVFLDCARDDVTGRDVYQLWAYAAQTLQSQPDPFLTVHTAQLRLLNLVGFAPDLAACRDCRRFLDSQGAWFSFSTCGLQCGGADCRRPDADSVHLSAGALACLQYIGTAPLPRLFQFKLTPAVRQEVCRFSERYLQVQMEKVYTRLAMLQSLDLGSPAPD